MKRQGDKEMHLAFYRSCIVLVEYPYRWSINFSSSRLLLIMFLSYSFLQALVMFILPSGNLGSVDKIRYGSLRTLTVSL
jgi:hypothetical protein